MAAVTLSRTRCVLDRTHVGDEFVRFAWQDDPGMRRGVLLIRADYEDLGAPEQITVTTVTIEPGDLLNTDTEEASDGS